MPTVKDKIFIGSTYSVKYECLQPSGNADQPFAYQQTQKNPTSATAELWDVAAQAYIPLGPSLAQATDALVVDNVVSYTLPSHEITTEGDYKLVITVYFDDGQIVRDIRPFKVVAIS